MSIGEMLQLQQKNDLELGEEAYFELVDQKTASLMAASTEIGALVGRLGSERASRFRSFGEALGRAYQVTDDLFDYLGDPEEIGKGVRTDLPEGKITLPLIRALAAAGARDRALLREIAARRSVLEAADWRALLGLLEKTGAIEYCREKARGLAAEALALLHGEPPSPWRESLEKAVAYAVQRIH
jgi:octaprenyl-diphosphate synthase